MAIDFAVCSPGPACESASWSIGTPRTSARWRSSSACSYRRATAIDVLELCSLPLRAANSSSFASSHLSHGNVDHDGAEAVHVETLVALVAEEDLVVVAGGVADLAHYPYVRVGAEVREDGGGVVDRRQRPVEDVPAVSDEVMLSELEI